VGIAKLEQALGARLFLRNSRRVQLTEAGVRLLAHARAIESEFNSLEGRISGRGAGPVLRVGVLSTIPGRLVSEFVTRSRAAAPQDTLELVEGSERDLVGRLQRRRLDVALSLIRTDETRFPTEPLYEEGYSLAAHAAHVHATAAAIPGDLLGAETMIVRRHCEALSETSRYFTERGVRPHFAFRSTNDERTVALVKAGLGVTVIPDSFAEPGLSLIKLIGFDQTRRIGLIFASPEIAARRDLPALEALRAVRFPA
ncbi:MAG TPA: LysR substrate-binding domain-containing protein, partial [Phenylobacterium sp.]|nr:LysR substrate-binding domain-containing protein [Phenylobacterium sp.]